MLMFRTRFKRDILTEFLPPLTADNQIAGGASPAKKQRTAKKERVILLCDGMPSIPRKQPLAEFLAKKGYWVFYPRYRGAWRAAASSWRGRRTWMFWT